MKTWISSLVGIATGCLVFYYTLIYRGMSLESSKTSGITVNGNLVLNLLLIIGVAIIIGLIIYSILTLFEKKLYAKWLLGLSVMVILLTIFIFGSFTLDSIAHSSQQSYIATEIINVAKNKSNVSEEIESLIQQSNHISDVKINNIKNLDTSISKYVDNATPTYQYHRELFTPKWTFAELSTYGVGDENWYIEMNTKNYEQLSNYILVSGIAIYWFLFVVWAILNVKHQRELNFGWVIIFIVFNVLGYLLYKFEQVSGKVNTSFK
ncbi:hypothetical protein [Bacillus sp. Marseille-Q3570]|uniref:hypothetical protein n=1 Tax=Bacillus sp. Marseille-Q3570 TaxID=2963522 RepID=UPI0021B7EBDE|nr:hypothetical protein [Bacillus sp. Marseille-Q3570]